MLTVQDLMTSNPLTVAPETPIHLLRDLMAQQCCHQLPVVKNGKLVGIVTERDIKSVEFTPIYQKGTTETIMTENPITVSPNTVAHRAVALLNAYKFNALPVLDGDKVVGIITTSNFLSSICPQD